MIVKENLLIENFLIVKQANVDIKKINIFIGPQANGKSVIAKLIYFFREVINDKLLLSISKNENKKELILEIDSLFNQYFPNYAWKDKSFNIEYRYLDFRIIIYKDIAKRKISVEINDSILKIHRDLKAKFRKYKSVNEERKYGGIFWEFKKRFINGDEFYNQYFSDAIFIPASRSFFANLQKNIFSFLSENIDIDPFMKDFGSKYELAKKIYNDFLFRDKELESDKVFKKINNLIENILQGRYRFKDEKDWIEQNGELINLSNSSSGQQESLPMLLILIIFPFIIQKRGEDMYFLEEPEAHLFPISQKHIVSIISMIYNMKNSFIITTHSPYILSAINNLILANDMCNAKNKDEIYKLVDKDTLINIDDLSAYTIEKGYLSSIINYETRLIGMNIIDSVSDDFGFTFDNLLKLGFDND